MSEQVQKIIGQAGDLTIEKIDCAYHDLISVDWLATRFDPENCNRHSLEQIELAANTIKANGFREAVIVDKSNECLVSGECRTLAALKLGWKCLPVQWQSFKGNQRFSYSVAANELGKHASLDGFKFIEKFKGLGDETLLPTFCLRKNPFDIKKDEPQEQLPTTKIKLTISLDYGEDEEAEKLFKELTARGYSCKVKIP